MRAARRRDVCALSLGYRKDALFIKAVDLCGMTVRLVFFKGTVWFFHCVPNGQSGQPGRPALLSRGMI